MDKSKVHNLVPLEQYLFTPKCQDHPSKQCELYCEQCNVPICSLCITSEEHRNHDFVDMMEIYQKKQKHLKEDYKELVESIFPKYEAAASNILLQKAKQTKHFKQIKKNLSKQGKKLHMEIDTIIQSLHSKIDEMENKYIVHIDKHEKKIRKMKREI